MHLVTRLAAALFSGAWYRAAQTLPLMLVYRQAVRAAQTVTLVYMQAGATCGTKIACHVGLQAGGTCSTDCYVGLQAGATCKKTTLPVTLNYRRAVVQPKYQLSR